MRARFARALMPAGRQALAEEGGVQQSRHIRIPPPTAQITRLNLACDRRGSIPLGVHTHWGFYYGESGRLEAMTLFMHEVSRCRRCEVAAGPHGHGAGALPGARPQAASMCVFITAGPIIKLCFGANPRGL